MKIASYSWLRRLYFLPMLAHEYLHYLPAWYWGLEPRIDPSWSRMRHRRTTDHRTLVIVLAPTMVGLFALPGIWMLAAYSASFWVATVLFWLGWMGGCAIDIYEAGYFLLYHRWRGRDAPGAEL